MCCSNLLDLLFSTDAGNMRSVWMRLRADAGDPIVLVTPAFPEPAARLYGNLFVVSCPLNESPLRITLSTRCMIPIWSVLRARATKIGSLPTSPWSRAGRDAVRAHLAGLSGSVLAPAVIDAFFGLRSGTIRRGRA